VTAVAAVVVVVVVDVLAAMASAQRVRTTLCRTIALQAESRLHAQTRLAVEQPCVLAALACVLAALTPIRTFHSAAQARRLVLMRAPVQQQCRVEGGFTRRGVAMAADRLGLSPQSTKPKMMMKTTLALVMSAAATAAMAAVRLLTAQAPPPSLAALGSSRQQAGTPRAKKPVPV